MREICAIFKQKLFNYLTCNIFTSLFSVFTFHLEGSVNSLRLHHVNSSIIIQYRFITFTSSVSTLTSDLVDLQTVSGF